MQRLSLPFGQECLLLLGVAKFKPQVCELVLEHLPLVRQILDLLVQFEYVLLVVDAALGQELPLNLLDLGWVALLLDQVHDLVHLGQYRALRLVEVLVHPVEHDLDQLIVVLLDQLVDGDVIRDLVETDSKILDLAGLGTRMRV